ncbi:MAG: hypothetical protein GY715_06100 [Planctomycetes bacterium]|nr:hypothetical protein [Planctomycetota bacterium]
MAGGTRTSWLADDGSVAVDDLARRMESFVKTMADGIVSDDELAAQEKRLADLMRDIEPKLDDAMHARITELLCELTAFDIMQVVHAMQASQPKTVFNG